MDKRTVIAAYRRGFITIQECAQIIGLEASQLAGIMSDPKLAAEPESIRKKHPAHG